MYFFDNRCFGDGLLAAPTPYLKIPRVNETGFNANSFLSHVKRPGKVFLNDSGQAPGPRGAVGLGGALAPDRRPRAGLCGDTCLRLSLGLGCINLAFGMKLLLPAVIAAVQAQPRQRSHPHVAAHAFEVVDATWAGGKQAVHKGRSRCQGPLAKLYGLSADVYSTAPFFP